MNRRLPAVMKFFLGVAGIESKSAASVVLPAPFSREEMDLALLDLKVNTMASLAVPAPKRLEICCNSTAFCAVPGSSLRNRVFQKTGFSLHHPA